MDTEEEQIQLVAAKNSIGGYDFEFEDELSMDQMCPISLVAMRNPVHTTCGHRFCEESLLFNLYSSDSSLHTF